MSKTPLRSLVVTLALILTLLGLAGPTLAAPRQCDVSCTCSSRCNQPCSIGASVTNCGYWDVCSGSDLCVVGLAQLSGDALWSEIFAPVPAQPSQVEEAPAAR